MAFRYSAVISMKFGRYGSLLNFEEEEQPSATESPMIPIFRSSPAASFARADGRALPSNCVNALRSAAAQS